MVNSSGRFFFLRTIFLYFGTLIVTMLSSCLAIWWKSHSNNLCPKYMHHKQFFRAQDAKCSLLWEGDTPLPDPPPARLLCSLAVLLADKGFRRHGNIGHFQKRSLANYWDECIWNVMLKARCYRLAPLLFGGNHIPVIFAQNKYASETVFSGSKCKILPALGGGHPLPGPSPPPPPLGRFAHSQFS